jgi:integrase
MGKSYEIDAHSFRDGRIVLYKRPNLKKPVWQVRLRVPGVRGYVIRTTGSSDLYEARRFADDLLDDLRLQVGQGVGIKGKPFKKCLDEYRAIYPTRAPSDRRVKDAFHFLDNYAARYFGKMHMHEVTPAEVHKFQDWRQSNGLRKGAVSNGTVLNEISHLKGFLDWCAERGYLLQKIHFARPSQTLNRRPHFDEHDWRKLTRFFREWIKQGKTEKGGGRYRDRLILVNYVLILANTGIRVGEARGLRWKNVIEHPDDELHGGKAIVLRVSGKTGPREVVARTAEVGEYLNRIRDLRVDERGGIEPLPDDFVFCHRNGSPVKDFKRGFESLIRAAGVEYDNQRQRRTLYSLRHTYATFRLREGVDQFALARNMGTSPKMLDKVYGHTTNLMMAEELTKTRKRATKHELSVTTPG